MITSTHPSHEVRGLRPGLKLAAFAVVLAAAFGVGAAVGTVAGPIQVGDAPEHPTVHVHPAP